MKELLTDQQFVDLLDDGSDKAFAGIYNRYWFKPYSSVFHQTRARKEAQELAHDIFKS